MTSETITCEGMQLSRRAALLGLGCALSLGRVSMALADAPAAGAATDRRLVVVLLRGGLDGMSAVVPYGDPNLIGLRGALLPPAPPGQPGGLLDLGGFYGLHPSLTGLHDLYRANQALLVHAVAGPYRSRSHFQAQDYMESGADHGLSSGWLNRAASALPRARHAAIETALSVDISAPLLLRGPAPVAGWAPTTYPALSKRLYGDIAALHRADPQTGPVFADALRNRAFTDATLAGVGSHGQDSYAFPALASATGKLLASPTGPRVAALEVVGWWDTHMQQPRRLAGPLGVLDQGLMALRTAMGDAWRQTAVLVITEFGRTVRVNGDLGTDHGTATAAVVLGGAIQGGRVVADWPGLARGRLFEDRDLQPTADIRSVAKGLLRDHMGLSDAALAATFPGSDAAAPMAGLVRAGTA